MNRLRQNLLLKIISLVASIVLYFYVQSERFPIISRPLVAPIVPKSLPADSDVDADSSQLEVSVTGPRPLVDRLKDGDVRLVASLRGVEPGAKRGVPMHYEFPTLSPEAQSQLTLDPPESFLPLLRVAIFPRLTRLLSVTPIFPKNPPEGYTYGQADTRPAQIKVSGHAERVRQVARLVVSAWPPRLNNVIDGDFQVAAVDSHNAPVEDITLTPATVHVSAYLVEKAVSRTIAINPSYDLPAPPYTLEDIQVTPARVHVSGRPEDIAALAFLKTRDIPVHAMTESQTVNADLVVPHDLKVTDEAGHSLASVQVRVKIRKATTPPPTGGTGIASDPVNPPDGTGKATHP